MKLKTQVFVGFSLGFFLVLVSPVWATTYNVDIFAIVPGCGDGFVGTGEECDGSNLGGSSCESLGFSEGVLACSSVCTFITSSCLLEPPQQGGATRISNSRTAQVPATNIVVSGWAAPTLNVTLLKDGQRVGSAIVRGDGQFQVTVSSMAPGTYSLQLVGTSLVGDIVRSETFVVRVLGESTTKVSGIILPPILNVTESPGELLLRGFAPPNATVVALLDGVKNPVTYDVTKEGVFEFAISDDGKRPKIVQVETKLGLVSTLSSERRLESGEQIPEVTSPVTCSLLGDITKDCRISIVDFAVAKWWYSGGMLKAMFDLNNDNRLDIVDFSIMAYFWTG